MRAKEKAGFSLGRESRPSLGSDKGLSPRLGSALYPRKSKANLDFRKAEVPGLAR